MLLYADADFPLRWSRSRAWLPAAGACHGGRVAGWGSGACPDVTETTPDAQKDAANPSAQLAGWSRRLAGWSPASQSQSMPPPGARGSAVAKPAAAARRTFGCPRARGGVEV